MGTRVRNALKDDPEYTLLYVESPSHEERLRARGDVPTPKDEALKTADVVLLAVPDNLVGRIAADVVPRMKPGAMVICLDPAAPYGGELPERKDITYFVTHPAHPPIYNDETDMEARRDYFGSGKAKQAIVSALAQGPEEDYVKGEAISAKIFGPILRSHRISVEHMAMLEPALSETIACTCLSVMREALDETVRRGVPEAAARDFLMGHINIALAIAFNEIDWDFSEGAKKAIEEAKKSVFQPDWKKVFEPENLRESVRMITQTPS